jgi:hypothetical protein
MVVLDVALPSGFAPVEASLATLAQQSSKKIKQGMMWQPGAK